jgi:hypothetical protein
MPGHIDTANLTVEQKHALDIALHNDTIIKNLDDQKYVITAIVIPFNNTTLTPENNVLVAFDLLYPDGSIDYHLVAGIDLKNNSVGSIIVEKPMPRNLSY